MSTFSPELLRLRVWLAEVRDDLNLPKNLAVLARVACHLLDLRETLQAENLRADLYHSVVLVIDQLAAAGLHPPVKLR